MNYKFLNELERNLEIQAHSYLLQEDDKHFESQKRTEFAQLTFVNRLNSHIGDLKKFRFLNFNLEGLILEVCSDFVIVLCNSLKVILNLNYLESVEDLNIKSKILGRFEEKWNFRSALRELMLQEKAVYLHTFTGSIYQGQISNIFLNHLDIANNCGKTSINLNSIVLAKYRDEI